MPDLVTTNENLTEDSEPEVEPESEVESNPPTVTVTDDDTSGDNLDPDDADPAIQPKKSGYQKKIDKLTKLRREAELKAAYWEGVAKGSGAKEKKPDPPDKISRDDFDTEDEYLEALVDSKIAKGSTKSKSNVDVITVQAQYAGGRKKYKDFDDVALSETLPITEAMFEAAVGKNLADILYYLGKNPKMAASISTLSPTQAAKEIGRIEVELKTTKPKSNAPLPAPRVKGSGGNPVPIEKTKKDRFSDWEKKRLERLGINQ